MRTSEVNGFLRAEGTKLINGVGQEVLLRGVGLGSWLLPEGYMWRFPEGGDRPRRMEQMVQTLVGAERAAAFWQLYYERYVGEADIARIAAEGFNSIRVSILARMLLEEGEPIRFREDRIALIDRVIGWCRDYGLYVILDLHGAPGGQTGTNIDDSERDLPELFLDATHRIATVALWRLLAKRYKDEWIVAGYDLLNEPLPEWFSTHYAQVMPLYEEIIQAIREVDTQHLLILEGVHWSTDWSIFQQMPDENVMIQFHKYWNNPDTESIQTYLDKRAAWNVPIFMGEGGENNKEWYVGGFRLFEDHEISWNFWTWKKMDTTNSPCSIRMPEGWQLLVDFLEGGEKPDAHVAERVLWAYLNNLPLTACDYYPQVVRSLFSRAPVRLPAIFYGYHGAGRSYGFGVETGLSKGADAQVHALSDRRSADRSGDGLSGDEEENHPGIEQEARIASGFRSSDGTDIRFVEGQREKPNFQHGRGEEWLADERMCMQLGAGDWLAYSFQAASGVEEASQAWAIRLRVCGVDGEGELSLDLDGVPIGSVKTTGSGWEILRVAAPDLSDSGEMHAIIVTARGLPVRLEWIEVVPA